jgi:hypothetical protein
MEKTIVRKGSVSGYTYRHNGVAVAEVTEISREGTLYFHWFLYGNRDCPAELPSMQAPHNDYKSLREAAHECEAFISEAGFRIISV